MAVDSDPASKNPSNPGENPPSLFTEDELEQLARQRNEEFDATYTSQEGVDFEADDGVIRPPSGETSPASNDPESEQGTLLDTPEQSSQSSTTEQGVDSDSTTETQSTSAFQEQLYHRVADALHDAAEAEAARAAQRESLGLAEESTPSTEAEAKRRIMNAVHREIFGTDEESTSSTETESETETSEESVQSNTPQNMYELGEELQTEAPVESASTPKNIYELDEELQDDARIRNRADSSELRNIYQVGEEVQREDMSRTTPERAQETDQPRGRFRRMGTAIRNLFRRRNSERTPVTSRETDGDQSDTETSTEAAAANRAGRSNAGNAAREARRQRIADRKERNSAAKAQRKEERKAQRIASEKIWNPKAAEKRAARLQRREAKRQRREQEVAFQRAAITENLRKRAIRKAERREKWRDRREAAKDNTAELRDKAIDKGRTIGRAAGRKAKQTRAAVAGGYEGTKVGWRSVE